MVVYILISMYYFYIKSISIKTPRVCMSRAATIYGNCQVFQGLSIMLSIFIHPAQWTILIKYGHCNSQNLILLVQKLTFPHLISWYFQKRFQNLNQIPESIVLSFIWYLVWNFFWSYWLNYIQMSEKREYCPKWTVTP